MKSGYRVAVFPAAGATTVGTASATCNASTRNPASAFGTTADPVAAGTTGTRYFAADMRGAIFYATAASFGTAAIPSTSTHVQ